MIRLFEQVGLTDVRIVDRFDCFRETSKEAVATELTVHGVNLFARRPA
ncbi:MAG TPA: hypothetical protein VKT77_09740 [Chthonomonadaceae bacterium]|nr:hypothetical protein [Chthonomonadaceae bacterium]